MMALSRSRSAVPSTAGFPGTSTGPGTRFDESDVLLSKPYRKHGLAKAVEEVLTARP
jgi:hypothetical protein